MSLSGDGLVYVSDRVNDRYQVFTTAGHFLQGAFIRPATLGNGSVWGMTFSDDARQKYLLIPDGENTVVWEILRSSGQVVGSFGHGINAESSTGCTSRSLIRAATFSRVRSMSANGFKKFTR